MSNSVVQCLGFVVLFASAAVEKISFGFLVVCDGQMLFLSSFLLLFA